MRLPLPLFAMALLAGPAPAAVSLLGPSTDWTSLGDNFDYLIDQQTGQAESDIVGGATDPGFFTTFDNLGTGDLTDGLLAFRVRFDAAGKKDEFTVNLWVGIDADSDGALELFLGVNTQGGSSLIEIRDAGTGLNNSPSTTSISNTSFATAPISSANFDYRAVDFTSDGGTSNDLTTGTSGDPDYYVSFLVDFADVVAALSAQGIAIDQTSPLRYTVATSTQVNSLNQDLGGIDGNDPTNDPDTPWDDNGGFTPTVTATGESIPEPAPTLLLSALCLLALLRRRSAPAA